MMHTTFQTIINLDQNSLENHIRSGQFASADHIRLNQFASASLARLNQFASADHIRLNQFASAGLSRLDQLSPEDSAELQNTMDSFKEAMAPIKELFSEAKVFLPGQGLLLSPDLLLQKYTASSL